MTISTQLAYGVQLLLGRLGKYARVRGYIQKSGYGKGKHIYHIDILNPKIRRHVKKTSHLNLSNGEEVKGMFFYRPIRRVEVKRYKGFVYHLEVEEDRTYQVHGITVHNSLEDSDMGSRLTMAGYKDMFLLDANHWVVEHEHEPIPEDVIARDVKPIKCNYSVYLLNRKHGRWRANSTKLTKEDIEFIRQESLKPPCSPKPHFYADDCKGDLFRLWASNSPIFDLREERLDL